MPQPWLGPSSRMRRIRRSSVPWSNCVLFMGNLSASEGSLDLHLSEVKRARGAVAGSRARLRLGSAACRDVVPGSDVRETTVDGFDILQCRPSPTASNTCQNAGGLNQNIYGARIVVP